MRRFGRASLVWHIPGMSCLLFALAGLGLIRWPGWENIELFFAGPLYDPNALLLSAQRSDSPSSDGRKVNGCARGMALRGIVRGHRGFTLDGPYSTFTLRRRHSLCGVCTG
jgi:hypothetical protein